KHASEADVGRKLVQFSTERYLARVRTGVRCGTGAVIGGGQWVGNYEGFVEEPLQDGSCSSCRGGVARGVRGMQRTALRIRERNEIVTGGCEQVRDRI